MKRWVLRIGVLVVLAAAIGFINGRAAAGILADSTKALPGFQGTRNFHDDFFFNEVTAGVDFAAFAPDTFDDFLSEFGIVFDPNVPTDHYVYAYQVHVVAPTDPPAETFSVGTAFSGTLGGSAPSYIPLSAYGDGVGENGDEEPTSTSYQGQLPADVTSATWTYIDQSSGTVDPNEWMAIMFFSSTAGPTWDSAQVNAGLASARSTDGENYPATGLAGTGVPSPSPEPSSVLLLSLGALIALVAWNQRRRIC